MKTTNRIIVFDAWRGLAIIGMVFFHAALILDYFDTVDLDLYDGGWLLFVRCVQFSFLLLVGIALVLSYTFTHEQNPKAYYIRQLKRAAVIGMWALVITFVTWIAVPDIYVRFGILHLIAVGVLCSLPLVVHPKLLWPTILLSLLVTYVIYHFSTDSLLLHIVGVPKNQPLYTMDYFAIFPWIICIFFGVWLGRLLMARYQKRLHSFGQGSRVVSALAYIGQYSLRVYVVHVPILLILFWLVSLI